MQGQEEGPAQGGGLGHRFGFDGQQNARVLTDESGNVTDGYVYTAFGEERAKQGV